MPLPEAVRRNGHFENGDASLNAFVRAGRVRTRTQIRTRPPRQDVFAMDLHSPHFAVIHNPHETDAGGVLTGQDADTSRYGYPNARFANSYTYATRGAWLEIQGVAFHPGERLRFQYNFLPFEELRSRNDFAVFVVEQEDGQVVFSRLLAEVLNDHTRPGAGAPLAPQPISGSPVLQSGWGVYVWSPDGQPAPDWAGRELPRDRKGPFTLRWVASNGIVGQAGAPPTDPDANAEPSPLLLDAIEMAVAGSGNGSGAAAAVGGRARRSRARAKN